MLFFCGHIFCRLLAAGLLLAGLGRTPGRVCCGPGVAGYAVATGRGAATLAGAAAPTCHHCSKSTAKQSCSDSQASCPDRNADHRGHGSDDSRPCGRGACAAVCCHVNAVATAQPPLTAPGELVFAPVTTDPEEPGLAERDGIFHPPRA